MKIYKLIISLLLVTFFPPINAEEKTNYGDKSQNITAKGNVNTYYEAGDKIANIRIDRKNINKRTTIIPINTNINIKKLKTLVIPKKLGFSEIFYNKKTNNYYIKNHKYNTIKKTYLSKKTNNYIDNSITKISNSRTTNNNSVNNGTIQKISGAYSSIGISETYRVRGGSVNGQVYNGDITVSKTYFYAPNNTDSYQFGITINK